MVIEERSVWVGEGEILDFERGALREFGGEILRATLAYSRSLVSSWASFSRELFRVGDPCR